MKLSKTKSLFIALLSLAGAALTASTAMAQNTLTYNDGDLLMGFSASAGTGSSLCYLIDLGPVTQFLGLTTGTSFTLSLGNTLTDLQNTFGTSWNTDASLSWGVAAYDAGGTNTLYLSKKQNTVGTPGTGYTRASTGAQSLTVGAIQTLGSDFSGFQVSSTNSSVAAVENDSDQGSWQSYMPGGTSSTPSTAFSAYAGINFLGNFANGVTGTALDLFTEVPSSTAGHLGTYDGTFTISSGGVVDFAVESVPEPSTFAVILLGAGILAFVPRQRRMTKAG